MLYRPNKDLVFAPSTVERPKGELALEEARVGALVGLPGIRLPSIVRRMVVEREGELHRLDAPEVCRRILERLKAGTSVQHAVEEETRGMSHDQLALVVETLEATVGHLHMQKVST